MFLARLKISGFDMHRNQGHEEVKMSVSGYEHSWCSLCCGTVPFLERVVDSSTRIPSLSGGCKSCIVGFGFVPNLTFAYMPRSMDARFTYLSFLGSK